ncbi:MAG: flavodoxin family protein [bacterium]|nr:flavodoxin family protein [bacterium]MDT8366746.1 flavodoxin family protein [bacterium]
MKVVAINGSARKDGNTAISVRRVFGELEEEGISTELIQLAGQEVRGCLACFRCFQNRDRKCAVMGDFVNECIGKMDEADGIILASPTYFATVTTELKAVIDRAGLVAIANGNMFARKVGAAVVSVRRGGAVTVFDTINHFFFIEEMVVPGSSYWNFAMGLHPGEVEDDEEGMKTMGNLGKNMAWLLKKIHG